MRNPLVSSGKEVDVPLSDHEQRLLEQIERALYAEDPKFASSVRSTDLRTHYRRRMVRAVIGFILGIGILLAGVITQAFYLALGVLGFLVMLGSALLGVTAWRRLQLSRGGGATRPPGTSAPKPSVL